MDTIKTGRLIADKRKQKGYTQQQLAELLNLSNKTISKWESGAGCPDISNLEALADIFGITVDELLKGSCSSADTDQIINSGACPEMKSGSDSGLSSGNHSGLSSGCNPEINTGPHMTNGQKWAVAIVLLTTGLGAILGILAYNYGWLG